MNPCFRLFYSFFFIVCLFSAAYLYSQSKTKMLDMTFAYDESTIYWPTATPFKIVKVSWKILAGGWWYASNDYSASEHGGTHVDAPIHFAKKGRTIGQIALHEWIGPAVKIDVTRQCLKNRDYQLSVADILGWEKLHGPIPRKAWILMYTGIGTRFYPQRRQVLGTDKTGPEAVAFLSFPGFSVEAVRFLLIHRNIIGIGLDTPSIDYGKSKDFKVHQLICRADKFGIENIANLDKLPAKGAMLYAIPMLIQSGTGAPARVFAILP